MPAKGGLDAMVEEKISGFSPRSDFSSFEGRCRFDQQSHCPIAAPDPRPGSTCRSEPGAQSRCRASAKDATALLRIAEEAKVPLRIVESVVSVNEGRKRNMVRRIVQACGGSVRGMKIAILGVTFKPNTDDVRDSPSLVIVPALQAEGATVQAHDPEGMATASRELPGVTWCEDVYDAMDGADAMVILTEWNAFRALDLERVRDLLRRPVVVDLRNVYEPAEMIAAGFSYTSIGRPVPNLDLENPRTVA
jgi:UDP-glucose 6-dehydrogenase